MNSRIAFTAAAPFEAARRLDGQADEHRGRWHGHSFVAQVRAELPAGWAAFPGAEAEQLAEQLRETIAPLDYVLLNDHLPNPTDEQLAHWIGQRLKVPRIVRVGIQAGSRQGLVVTGNGQIQSWQRFRFEAAHCLPKVPPGHPCGRMHGHGFEVILWLAGPNYKALEGPWAALYPQLHLACLNELPGLENPTSEHLAAWLWARLQPALPELCRITVYETATAGCHYQNGHYRIWKERVFESATRLHRAPATDRRSRLHGHSYRLRLHLAAPLDEVMGWTVDYGVVKALFKPFYRQLDHHRLDQLPGLTEATLTELLAWIGVRMAAALPALDRIELEQTPGCGAIWCRGDQP